jgi:hypothetical protein
MSSLRYRNGIADTPIDSQLLRSYHSNPQTMLHICLGKIGLFSSFLFYKTGWMSLTIFTGEHSPLDVERGSVTCIATVQKLSGIVVQHERWIFTNWKK